jgi:DNA-binding transcriptional LysR family regulator
MHLAPLWPAFLQHHPKVTLDVTLADRIIDLVDEGYDLAVRIAQLPASSLVSRKLASTRLVLCASPEYLRRHGQPSHPADIARHTVFTYTLLATGDTWNFQGPDGPVEVKVTPRLRSNNGDTCCAAALQHQGIVLQPAVMVSHHRRAGALVEVVPRYRSLELGVYAVYASRRHVTPKVRVAIDFLVEAFRICPW